jgi:hypothetical protein
MSKTQHAKILFLTYYLTNKINGDSTESPASPDVTKHDTIWNIGI